MTGIGEVIKQLRLERGMKVTDLASGICTEKHIYLIERGQRIPSLDIVVKLSERMKTDVFDVVRFLEYENPVEVSNLYSENEYLRCSGQFDALKDLMKRMDGKGIFEHERFQFIKALNLASIEAYQKRDYARARDIITSCLGMGTQLENIKQEDVFHCSMEEMKLFNLLCECLIEQNEFKGASAIIDAMKEALRLNKGYESFWRIFVDNSLNQSRMYQLNGRYSDAIKALETIEHDMQRESTSYRMSDIYYLLAANHQMLGEGELAKDMAERAIVDAKNKGNANQLAQVMSLLTEIELAKALADEAYFSGSNFTSKVIDEENNLIAEIKLIKENIVYVRYVRIDLRHYGQVYEAIDALLNQYASTVVSVHQIDDFSRLDSTTFLMDYDQGRDHLSIVDASDSKYPRFSKVVVASEDYEEKVEAYREVVKTLYGRLPQYKHRFYVRSFDSALRAVKVVEEIYRTL